MSVRTDRVRVVGLVKRKEGISKEEFNRYWVEHGKLFAGLAVVKRNLLKYEQCFVHSDTVRAFGLPAVDYDGIGIVEAESFAKIAEIISDEEFTRIIPQDEEKFLDRAATRPFPLNIATVLDKNVQ
ncbi:hypothetical protein PLICRDRAFT_45646 [Plicaturopsis crispa FD-325 SS-3]|uniref:EthD domain-containing protein n=1 Tax=Plicaturopsis crispa FD-325 SS-3 TaxID=944288 RepID=A0A0C9SY71_PLICR|nr:hypothetical protein PLICRDRAFT_45646 [Plicaturopsis crispa FD-325 SS-3]